MYDLVSTQFGGQSIHFGVNLFTALTCIAAGWLYLDAFSERHRPGALAKGGGFLLLAASFIITGAAWGDTYTVTTVAEVLKLVGYLAVATGLLIEPLQTRPKITGYAQITPASSPPAPPETPAAPAALVMSTAGLAAGLGTALPIAALLVAALYWRVATTGLERHLKPLAYTFAVLALSDTLALTGSIWQTSSNPLLQPLAEPLGLFWILSHLTLFLATILLGRWVWRYLAKRLLSQLFLTITSLSFIIVLIATVSVAGLLLGSLQHDSLSNLQTATKVLGYAIDSKTADTRTNAEVLAQNPTVIAAVTARDHSALTPLATSLLINKQLSDVIVTDDTGVVLTRGSDPDRYGDSLSADSLVQHALIGSTTSSITSRAGAVAPTLVITTASPIRSGDQILGLTLTSLALDNAFVDGLKHKTGLDSAIYSGTTRAATTLTGPGSSGRSLGLKETTPAVLNQTIQHGQIWQGIVTNAGRSYLSVYLPLKDVDNSVVGMLFVGQPQDIVLGSAKAAIKTTFVSASIALLLMMLPVYVVSRQISRQLH